MPKKKRGGSSIGRYTPAAKRRRIKNFHKKDPLFINIDDIKKEQDIEYFEKVENIKNEPETECENAETFLGPRNYQESKEIQKQHEKCSIKTENLELQLQGESSQSGKMQEPEKVSISTKI